MKPSKSLEKKKKAEARRIAIFLNKFLEKNLKEKDVSTASKIKIYWKTLEKNFWRQKMEPPGPYCLINPDRLNAVLDIPGGLKTEEVGAANVILWLHQLLKSVRDKFEKQKEIYEEKEDDGRAVENLIDYARIMRTKLKDPVNLEYEIIFEADLAEFMCYLERCEDNLCNKWFVQRSNKIFCSHGCASRYRKRMKEGKGDLQLSYRARRPNKKKAAMSEGGINGKKEYFRNI